MASATASDGKAAAASTSGVAKEVLVAAFRSKLSAEPVIVVDTSGDCGAKFEVVVVSTKFDGVSIIDRQRLVHDAVGADSMAKIHALSIKAWTPAQYETKKATLPANYKPAP